MLKAEIKVS